MRQQRLVTGSSHRRKATARFAFIIAAPDATEQRSEVLPPATTSGTAVAGPDRVACVEPVGKDRGFGTLVS